MRRWLWSVVQAAINRGPATEDVFIRVFVSIRGWLIRQLAGIIRA
jgi:hypothetical protein